MLEKTKGALERHGFPVKVFDSAAEAKEYLLGAVGTEDVGIGGCMTAQEMGLYEALTGQGNNVYWHWKEPGPATIAKANAAPVYLTGANAISADGEIVNIDGTGNRLAGQVYGQKTVYIIAGENKLCPDLSAAISRARNVAAVKNCARFHADTPCQQDGKCHDCEAAARICKSMLITMRPMNGMKKVEVILIREEMGY